MLQSDDDELESSSDEQFTPKVRTVWTARAEAIVMKLFFCMLKRNCYTLSMIKRKLFDHPSDTEKLMQELNATRDKLPLIVREKLRFYIGVRKAQCVAVN